MDVACAREVVAEPSHLLKVGGFRHPTRHKEMGPRIFAYQLGERCDEAERIFLQGISR